MPPASTLSDTKIKILDTAERMFATCGFAGTTLRNLAREAGVNLAAVGYHFGSKEDLFQAVAGRIATTIMERQVQPLKALEMGEEAPSLETVLTAYIHPGIEFIFETKELMHTRAQFLARCRAEPALIQEHVTEKFSRANIIFFKLLKRAVPEQSEAELFWKLDMVVTMLIRTLTEIGKPQTLLRSNTKKDIEYAVNELVKFTAAGIRAGSSRV